MLLVDFFSISLAIKYLSALWPALIYDKPKSSAFHAKPTFCSNTSFVLDVENEDPLLPAVSFEPTVALVLD